MITTRFLTAIAAFFLVACPAFAGTEITMSAGYLRAFCAELREVPGWAMAADAWINSVQDESDTAEVSVDHAYFYLPGQAALLEWRADKSRPMTQRVSARVIAAAKIAIKFQEFASKPDGTRYVRPAVRSATERFVESLKEMTK